MYANMVGTGGMTASAFHPPQAVDHDLNSHQLINLQGNTAAIMNSDGIEDSQTALDAFEDAAAASQISRPRQTPGV